MDTPANRSLRTGGWQEQVKPFRGAVFSRSVWQLANTTAAFVALWALMYWSLSVSYALTLLLSLAAGGVSVRFFIINHDCGHGSFFSSRRANDIVGFWTGLMAYTPYLQWRHGHALHHASSGQIEERGVGYFWIMGAKEFAEAPKHVRFWYRFYRNPFVLFTIGGLYCFLAEYRLSFRSVNARQRRGVWGANLVIAGLVCGLGLWLGFWNVFLIQGPICAVAAGTGLALFYVQHHYEDSYWAAKEEWDYEKAALEGSSYVRLPRVIEWFMGSINYHHIHHLVPKIPNYRLREAHHAIPLFRDTPPLSWKQIRSSWRLRLVDEETKRWVDFPAARPTVTAADPLREAPPAGS